MRKLLTLCLCLGLSVVPLSAAYTTATFDHYYVDASGAIHFFEVITGDSGEPAVPYEIVIADPGAGATIASVFGAANQAKIAALNRMRTLQFVVGLATPGQSIAVVFTPPAPVGASHYFTGAVPFTPGATPQDVCTLTGSATKTIVVNRASISTTQTTAGTNAWFLVKRSTANTGGTSTAPAIVPVDTLSPAAGATALTYTLNPTAGTLVGRYAVRQLASPTPATAVAGAAWVIDATFTSQITLRGTGETVAFNFNGAALPPGLSVACGFEWTEQ